MKKIVGKFVQRGLIFSGFGPLIYSIIMLLISIDGVEVSESGYSIFKGILSTYLLAFIVSGSSVVWNIDSVGLGYLTLIHGCILYLCYLGVYLINGWIKDDLINIFVFSLIFVAVYFSIVLIIYLIEKNRAKKFNECIKK